MERIPVSHILLITSKVHARSGHNKAFIVMALEVCLTLPPVVVHLITVRAIVCAIVRHIADSSASVCRCPSSMFDTDTLCFRGRNQWYPVDATIGEPFVKVWLLLPQGAGLFICNSQGQAEGQYLSSGQNGMEVAFLRV